VNLSHTTYLLFGEHSFGTATASACLNSSTAFF